jgi:hypothetical protein
LSQAEPQSMSQHRARVWSVRGGSFALLAGACVLALALTAGCSGGGGSGGTGGGNGGGFDNTDTGADDRDLGGGPDGTGTVPHVEILHELPGGDPSKDVAGSGADLGG